MNIERYIEKEILTKLSDNKAIIIYGPRQVGKTTLLNQVKGLLKNTLLLNGEEAKVKEILTSQSSSRFRELFGDAKIVLIDEAQSIDNIGQCIKLIVDVLKDIKVIATGSSSFELANQTGEPLVGRKWEYYLFPISQLELEPYESALEREENLEARLVFGSYPEVVTVKSLEDKRHLLENILNGYLLKDILALENLKKPQYLVDLLKLISFQIGKEVSIRELSNNLNIDFKTVYRYLDLLEKVFIIKKVYGFSRNLRKEITKNARYYFYDNGIRNIVINNLNTIKNRNDIGQLWENYLFSERIKRNVYYKTHSNMYFWRTWDQAEIDLVEEVDGTLSGFEFKWGSKLAKLPKAFADNYPQATFQTVNRDNYRSFIT